MKPYDIQVLKGTEPLASSAWAYEHRQTLVVDSVRVKWSRPSVLLPPEPSECTFTMLHNPSREFDRLALDDLVSIVVFWERDKPATVFAGYVDVIEYSAVTPSDKWQVITVQAIDALGRESRRRVGAEPWPHERMDDRIERFRKLIPNLVQIRTSAYAGPNSQWWTAPRLDIDSRNPVEVLQLHLNAYRMHFIAKGSGIAAIDAYTLSEELVYSETSKITRIRPAKATELPADSLRNVGKTLSYDSAINSVSISWLATTVNGNGDENDDETRAVTRTWGDPNSPGTAIRIDTLCRVSNSTARTKEQLEALKLDELSTPETMRLWAEQVVSSGAKPLPRLDRLSVLLSNLDDSYRHSVHTLTNMADRFANAIVILGVRKGLEANQSIVGGSLELSGDPSRNRLEIDTEPLRATPPETPIIWKAVHNSVTFSNIDASISFQDMKRVKNSRSVI